MTSSTMELLPRDSSSSKRAEAPPATMAAYTSYPGARLGAPSSYFSPPLAGGIGEASATAGRFPSSLFYTPADVERWSRLSGGPYEPKGKRPLLSNHGYYMCIAVSIVVGIGLVISFGFFIMQRHFANVVSLK